MKCSGSEACSLLTMFVGTGMLACSLLSSNWSSHYPRNSLERVSLTRGIFYQCISTRREKNCDYRFRSLLHSVKFAFGDMYEVYTDTAIKYRHLPARAFEVVTLALLLLSLVISFGVLVFSPILLRRRIAISCFFVLVAGVCCLLGCLSYFHANYTGSAFTMQATEIMGQPFNALVSPIRTVRRILQICEKNYLGWAFFMGFSSGIMYLSASFCLCLSERGKKEDEERTEQRTVLLV